MFAKRVGEINKKGGGTSLITQANTQPIITSESVKVIVRCRPFLESEKRKNENSCITIDLDSNQVSILRDRNTREYKTFRFDSVFDEYSS